MKLKEFPAFYLNSRLEAGRRNEIEWRLAQAGLRARRFPGVAAADVRRVLAGRPGADLVRQGFGGAEVPLNGLARDASPGVRVRGDGEATSEYARALGLRLVLRKARRERWPRVLILGDEVAFHPNFARLAEALEPPEDWEIFHLGHTLLDEQPDPAAAGIARVRQGTDFHAFAVRAAAYPALARALGGLCRSILARHAAAGAQRGRTCGGIKVEAAF